MQKEEEKGHRKSYGARNVQLSLERQRRRDSKPGVTLDANAIRWEVWKVKGHPTVDKGKREPSHFGSLPFQVTSLSS